MKKYIRANNYNPRGYLYILTNGLGPGTIPKDVSVLKSIELDDFGHPYKTAVWLSRWLTTEELKKYDIMPETNLRTKYGSDLIDEIESLRGDVTASRKITASENDGIYDAKFTRGGVTYFVEVLDFEINHNVRNNTEYIARWWDSSDNGVGYNNKGFVVYDFAFDSTGRFKVATPSNVKEFLHVVSTYGRNPNKSISNLIIDKVLKLVDVKDIVGEGSVTASRKLKSNHTVKASKRINATTEGTVYWLYSTENDYSNSFFVENLDTGEAIIVDWDLSDSEIDALIEDFEDGNLDYEMNGGTWENSIEDIYDSRYGCTHIGTYYSNVIASRKSNKRSVMASRKLQSLVGRPFREVDRILKQMGCEEVNYGDIDEYISYVEYKDAAGQHYDVEYETYASSSPKYSPKVVSGDVISIEGPDEWVDYIGPNEA